MQGRKKIAKPRGFVQQTNLMYLTIIGKSLSKRVMRLAKRRNVPIRKIIVRALDQYLTRHGE